MSINFYSNNHEDEDYIEMEVSSHSDRFVSVMSSTHPLEFEFQMSCSSLKRDTTSPADELFYNGKLLPLHLPPRLQMVENLLQNSKPYFTNTNTFDEVFGTSLANNTPANSTPFEPCDISPSESWQVSTKLNTQEYFTEYSTEMNGSVSGKSKKSWIRKLKLLKQPSLGSKLKFPRAYFKSLFAKPGCSDESSNIRVDNHIKIEKNPFNKIQTEDYQMQPTIKSFDSETSLENGASSQHRRSFSGVIKWFSTNKSSNSLGSLYKFSSSRTSNKCHKLQPLNRSSSINPDTENFIQGAIAHCKRCSQQQFHSRKYGSDMSFFSLSDSRIVNDDQEELCRG